MWQYVSVSSQGTSLSEVPEYGGSPRGGGGWGWGMRSHERGGLPLHKYLSKLLLKYILAFKFKKSG